MNTLTIKDAFRFGYEKTKLNLVFLIRSSAIVLIITALINSLQESASETSLVLGAIFFVLTFAIDLIIKIGYTKIYLKIVDNEPVHIRDVFFHHGYFSTYCVAYVLLSLLTLVGFMLFLVPGIIVICTFFFVPFLVIDKDMDVKEAFITSSQISKGKRWFILQFIAVAFLLNLIGLAIFVVGLLFTIPITYFAAVYIYRHLFESHKIPLN